MSLFFILSVGRLSPALDCGIWVIYPFLVFLYLGSMVFWFTLCDSIQRALILSYGSGCCVSVLTGCHAFSRLTIWHLGSSQYERVGLFASGLFCLRTTLVCHCCGALCSIPRYDDSPYYGVGIILYETVLFRYISITRPSCCACHCTFICLVSSCSR